MGEIDNNNNNNNNMDITTTTTTTDIHMEDITMTSSSSVNNNNIQKEGDWDENEITVKVDHLSFRYGGNTGFETQQSPLIIKDFNLELKAGDRCLLIGANGAGKSTVLALIGGKHLVKPDNAIITLNSNPFRDCRLNLKRSYLDTNWGMKSVAFAGYGVPLQADIAVRDMMVKLQNLYPERRDELVELLGINLDWKMHMVSDGQRRRVQLLLGLLRPFKLLLLDEITTCLDVVIRMDLMVWLKNESMKRGATIIYATHIFDGLDDWPTNVSYLTNRGITGFQGKLTDLPYYHELRSVGHPSPLLMISLRWLRKEIEDDKLAKKKEKALGYGAQNKNDDNSNSQLSAGGFAPGRLASSGYGLGLGSGSVNSSGTQV